MIFGTHKDGIQIIPITGSLKRLFWPPRHLSLLLVAILLSVAVAVASGFCWQYVFASQLGVKHTYVSVGALVEIRLTPPDRNTLESSQVITTKGFYTVYGYPSERKGQPMQLTDDDYLCGESHCYGLYR